MAVVTEVRDEVLIVTIDRPEALDIGLANRVARPGCTLETAVELARALAGFPQRCLRSDRRSAIGSLGMPEADALQREHELGVATIASGETERGARRFADGAGRHGAFTEDRP